MVLLLNGLPLNGFAAKWFCCQMVLLSNGFAKVHLLFEWGKPLHLDKPPWFILLYIHFPFLHNSLLFVHSLHKIMHPYIQNTTVIWPNLVQIAARGPTI